MGRGGGGEGGGRRLLAKLFSGCFYGENLTSSGNVLDQ